MRHARGVAGLAIGTIALAICGVTLMTSVIVGTLIDAGPYRTPARVVGLQVAAPTLQYPRIYFPHEDYLSLRDGTTEPGGIFEALMPLGVAYVMMTGSGEPAHLNAGVMPGDTFGFLGVPPLLGRTLTSDDDRPDAPSVIVIGEEIWRQAFGGDPGVLGRIVRIDDQPHEIVGVMPRRFTWGVLTAWLPMRLDLYGAVTGRFVQVTGWLRQGVSESQARTRTNVIFSALARARGDRYPASPAISFRHSALPAVREEVRQSLVLILAAVALLSIVACINVAALLLARATGRLKELSIRVSLGASRWQILRAQVVEAAVLAVSGAAVGVGLAHVLLPGLLAALPPGVLPLGAVVSVDSRVLWCMTAVTMIVSVACGVLPALVVTGANVEPLLRQAPAGSPISPAARRVWGLLVGVEVAVAMTLMVLTALFGRSLMALHGAPLYYSPDRVVALGITVSEQRYPRLAQATQFLQRAVEQIRAIPGVETAAIAFPSGPRNSTASTFELSGRRASADERVGVRVVTADFFNVYRIPTVRGRALEANDERAGRSVAVVNEAFARQYGGEADVLGRHIRVGALRFPDEGEAPSHEIVGVVRDVPNDRTPNRREPEISVPVATAVHSRNWFIVVRANTDEVMSLVKPLQRAVWTLDPDQAFRSVRTEHEMLWMARFGWPQFRALVLGMFGMIALAFVGAGAYGIVSYTTTRAARDIGIRIAIGSDRRAVLQHVLSRSLRPVFVGMAAGAGVAAAGGTLLRAFVGSVSPWDPAAYLAAAATLIVVTGLACYMPARRAAHLDPNVVLRGE